MRYKDKDSVPAGMRAKVEAQMLQDMQQVTKPNKHRAVRCQDASGRWYASKLERKVAGDLKARYGAVNVIEQVSFPLIDGRRMRPDFFVIEEHYEDGSFRARLLDAKGRATTEWKLKASILREKFGLVVGVISK